MPLRKFRAERNHTSFSESVRYVPNAPVLSPRFDIAAIDDVDAACNGARVVATAFEVSELQTCLDLCRRCHEWCLALTVTHSAWRGAVSLDAEFLRLLGDCAQLCQAAADFIARNSPLHGPVCSLCAVACAACAEAGDNVADMLEGSRLCRLCAASCLAVAV